MKDARQFILSSDKKIALLVLCSSLIDPHSQNCGSGKIEFGPFLGTLIALDAGFCGLEPS